MKSRNKNRSRQSRVRKSRLMARVITFGSWGILLILLTLVLHLFWQILPIAMSPKLLSIQEPLADNNRFYRTSALHTSQVNQEIIDTCTVYDLFQNSEEQSYVACLNKSGFLSVYDITEGHSAPEQVSRLDFTDYPFHIEGVEIEIHNSKLVLTFIRGFSTEVFLFNLSIEQPLLKVVRNAQVKVHGFTHFDQLALASQNSIEVINGHGQSLQTLSFEQEIVFTQVVPTQRAMVVGLDNGQVMQWSLVNVDGAFKLVKNYEFEQRFLPIRLLYQTNVNGILALSKDNIIRLFNRVTGEIVEDFPVSHDVVDGLWQGNNIWLFGENQNSAWELTNYAGFTTWNSLFEAQHYEGYQEPSLTWQSHQANDYGQVKFSLVPLIIGSLKASLLALIVAIPIALGAAVYSGFFAHGKLRHKLKPSIELLEAIPTVVLGFIAAIWLAPLTEQVLLALVLFAILLPIALIIMTFVLAERSRQANSSVGSTFELVVSIGLVGIITWGIIVLSPLLLSWLDALFTPLQDKQLSHKNTLVVALALGIAIAPSIYTLAEDAIYEVPTSLKQASFALGATRLQTLRSVVLKMAMPGILSAITLGLGRAFGETMIVLMVTGNTPIAEWDLLEGLRAMTANLAIELPESEVGSAHYQVLFLSAIALFSFTFVLNSIAEWLRKMLRKNYRYA